MKTVRVNRDELLKVLIENREMHVVEYQTSKAERRQKIAFELGQIHGKMHKDPEWEPEDIYHWPSPENHQDDYDRAIDMLKMSVSETIELSAQEFDQLVRDNWQWKQEFLRTANTYK